MEKEKIALAGAVILAAVFMGFMFNEVNSKGNYANHPIDESLPSTTGSQPAQPSGQLQVVSVRALSSGGYDNPSPTVQAGVPVRFDFSADPGSGCGRQIIIDGLSSRVSLISRSGETVSATFTPPTPGQYRFHCGMNMFRGVLTAT